jgi:hypothetical protein
MLVRAGSWDPLITRSVMATEKDRPSCELPSRERSPGSRHEAHPVPARCALLSCRPACTAADAAKPIKVFILAGQSNMEGHGFIAADPKRNEGRGSLEFLVKQRRDGCQVSAL